MRVWGHINFLITPLRLMIQRKLYKLTALILAQWCQALPHIQYLVDLWVAVSADPSVRPPNPIQSNAIPFPPILVSYPISFLTFLLFFLHSIFPYFLHSLLHCPSILPCVYFLFVLLLFQFLFLSFIFLSLPCPFFLLLSGFGKFHT